MSTAGGGGASLPCAVEKGERLLVALVGPGAGTLGEGAADPLQPDVLRRDLRGVTTGSEIFSPSGVHYGSVRWRKTGQLRGKIYSRGLYEAAIGVVLAPLRAEQGKFGAPDVVESSKVPGSTFDPTKFHTRV